MTPDLAVAMEGEMLDKASAAFVETVVAMANDLDVTVCTNYPPATTSTVGPAFSPPVQRRKRRRRARLFGPTPEDLEADRVEAKRRAEKRARRQQQKRARRRNRR